ncbi:MAG: hypothetical protein HAW67_06100 [Endozoicomonadaceae bacterium]|nr:hypothetical protein [Endozoicomonadaceae bacterium]
MISRCADVFVKDGEQETVVAAITKNSEGTFRYKDELKVKHISFLNEVPSSFRSQLQDGIATGLLTHLNENDKPHKGMLSDTMFFETFNFEPANSIYPDFVSTLTELGFIPTSPNQWELDKICIDLSDPRLPNIVSTNGIDLNITLSDDDTLKRVLIKQLLGNKLGVTFTEFGTTLQEHLRQGEVGNKLASRFVSKNVPQLSTSSREKLIDAFRQKFAFKNELYAELKTVSELTDFYHEIVSPPIELGNKISFKAVRDEDPKFINFTIEGDSDTIADMSVDVNSISQTSERLNNFSTFKARLSVHSEMKCLSIIKEAQTPKFDYGGKKMKTAFVVGDHMLDAAGQSLGLCLKDISSNTLPDNVTANFLSHQPTETLINRERDVDRINLYSCRKVFTESNGSTEQALIKSPYDDAEMVWINFDPKKYDVIKNDRTQKVESKMALS